MGSSSDVYTRGFYGTSAISTSYHLGANSRPDFIGLRHDGRYGVFESKGRAKSSSSQLRNAAKSQTQAINKIDGSDPAGRFACITYFGAAQLAVEVIDPVSALEGAPDFVPEPGFIASHYTLVVSLLEEETQRVIDVSYDGENFKAIEIDELDLCFGISTSVLKAAREGDDNTIEKYIRRRNEGKVDGLLVEQPPSSDELEKDEEPGEKEVENFVSTFKRLSGLGENLVVPEGFSGVTRGVDGHIIFFGRSWEKPRLRGRKLPRPKPEVDGRGK